MLSSIGAFIAWLFTKAFGFYLKPSGSKPVDPTLAALPLGSPQTDTIHQIVDMVLDRAILLCAGRPLLSFALPIVKGAIDALWPTIFPEAKAALAAKGITITKA